MAEIYDGGWRTDAARIGGVVLQTVRDWVLSFHADGPEGLLAGKAPGKSSKFDDAQRSALSRIIESGPIPAIHGAVRWRLKGFPGGFTRNSASAWTSRRSGARPACSAQRDP